MHHIVFDIRADPVNACMNSVADHCRLFNMLLAIECVKEQTRRISEIPIKFVNRKLDPRKCRFRNPDCTGRNNRGTGREEECNEDRILGARVKVGRQHAEPIDESMTSRAVDRLAICLTSRPDRKDGCPDMEGPRAAFTLNALTYTDTFSCHVAHMIVSMSRQDSTPDKHLQYLEPHVVSSVASMACRHDRAPCSIA